MKHAARLLFIFLVSSIVSATASAGLFRAYLSFNGNDGNPCTVGAPCRLLPAALAAVNDGGEIWMMDSANYNVAPVTINKSVKILAISGALGSLVANGGDAVIINAPGGTVTMKNLSVLNFNAGVNGVTIQDAASVHLEKLSIDGFTTDASSCINMNVATMVRVTVDDSFLRECRNGIYINQPVGLPASSSVLVDNTRIERSVNTGGPNGNGVWMQGQVAVVLRNSVIGGQVTGIEFDGLVANKGSLLEIINTTLGGNTTCLLFGNVAGGAKAEITITGSRIVGCNDAMVLTNTAATASAWVRIVDSLINFAGNNGIQMADSAASGAMYLELIRSQVTNIGASAVDLNVTNGSGIQFTARDTTLSLSGKLLKTSGSASFLNVSLIRSHLSFANMAIDHGIGRIELDGTHISYNANSIVNNGSSSIFSLQNNFIFDNVDNSGLNYIASFANVAPR